MPTYLMRDSERGVEPVVLDDGAAPLRGADGAHVGHAQGVAGVVATEVLGQKKQQQRKIISGFVSIVFLKEMTPSSSVIPNNGYIYIYCNSLGYCWTSQSCSPLFPALLDPH